MRHFDTSFILRATTLCLKSHINSPFCTTPHRTITTTLQSIALSITTAGLHWQLWSESGVDRVYKAILQTARCRSCKFWLASLTRSE